MLRWIYDIPGESGIPAADATLAYALEHRTDALVGFGLGGPEIGVPRAQFSPHFDAARAAGLRSVPHAGETTGPETIWESLRLLGAERIGHGVSAAQDPELLAHLADTGIVLEVCPTSNIATRAVDRIEDHPLRTFVEAGVAVTINSDDPPMFATSLNHDYAVAADLLDLDEAGRGRPGAGGRRRVVRARGREGADQRRDRGVRRPLRPARRVRCLRGRGPRGGSAAAWPRGRWSGRARP